MGNGIRWGVEGVTQNQPSSQRDCTEGWPQAEPVQSQWSMGAQQASPALLSGATFPMGKPTLPLTCLQEGRRPY